MLDVVCNEASPDFCSPSARSAMELAASPELALLSRQARAPEYIAAHLGLLTSRTGQAIEVPPELQPEYDLATQRLLKEAV